MKSLRVGHIVLQRPETSADRAALTLAWRSGRLDTGMADRMHPGAAKSVTLPPKLYRDPSVKAYIAGGDPAVLRALVPERHIPALADGIRRRESAEQITARLNEDQP